MCAKVLLRATVSAHLVPLLLVFKCQNRVAANKMVMEIHNTALFILRLFAANVS